MGVDAMTRSTCVRGGICGMGIRPLFTAILATAACVLLSPGIGRAQQGKDPPEKLEPLDLKKFGNAPEITNKWTPMKPGMRWIYEGTTIEDDRKVVPHRIEVT